MTWDNTPHVYTSAPLNNCVAFEHILGFELAQLLLHEHQIAQSAASYCEARKYKTGELRWEIQVKLITLAKSADPKAGLVH